MTPTADPTLSLTEVQTIINALYEHRARLLEPTATTGDAPAILAAIQEVDSILGKLRTIIDQWRGARQASQ
jgi:hypothetical protein